MKLLMIFMSLTTLSGCQLVQGLSSKYPAFPFNKDTKLCKVDKNDAQLNCTASDALKAYVTASEYCNQVYRWYERSDSNHGILKTSLGAMGTLAGSVGAPLSNGTTATAWSGLSGATNALQANVESNLAGSLASKRTQAIYMTAIRMQSSANKGENEYEKIISSIQLASNCSMAPAAADQAVLEAVATADVKLNGQSENNSNKQGTSKD